MNNKLNLIKHSAFHIEIYRNKPKRVILACLCVCFAFSFWGEAVLSNQSFVPFVLICLLSCKLLRTITGSTRFQFPSHEPNEKKFPTLSYTGSSSSLMSFPKNLTLKLFISTSYRVGRSSVKIRAFARNGNL